MAKFGCGLRADAQSCLLFAQFHSLGEVPCRFRKPPLPVILKRLFVKPRDRRKDVRIFAVSETKRLVHRQRTSGHTRADDRVAERCDGRRAQHKGTWRQYKSTTNVCNDMYIHS